MTELPGYVDEDLLKRIWSTLTDGTPVVVTTHRMADGDAIGSVLALWHGLKHCGVDAYALFEPPVKPELLFLEGAGQRVEALDGLPDRYHLAVLDAGDFERIGAWHEGLSGRDQTICIDHHASTEDFGDLCLASVDASSTGELVYLLLRVAQQSITPGMAECLYTAVVTDTGQFAFENTTPVCMEACGEFLRLGVDSAALADRLFHSQTEAQFRLRRLAMGTLQTSHGGQVASVYISREMFRRTGLHPIHTDRFANIPLHIDGVLAGVLLKQMPGDGKIKVSLRSRPPVDVCAVAEQFDGGGHVRAAGCRMEGTIEDVRRAIVECIERQLPEDD
jgi:phosphoesterase RecJ-like protein